MNDKLIELKNITKIYNENKRNAKVALDNINLTFPSTGLFFIVGKSGCGKTTLLNIIGGTDYETKGELYFGNNLMSLEYFADGNSYYNCYYLENNTLYGYKYNTISGEREIYSNLTNDSLNGIAYEMFANSKTYYGAEGLLKGLYDLALENQNNDFGEGMIKSTTSTGGTTYSYSFNFGLLEEVEAGLKYYLHKVEVSFTLDDSNFLNNMNVTCNTYVVDNKKTDFTILAKDDVTNTSLFYGADRIIPTGYPSDFPVLNDYSINNCIARLKATAKPDSSLSCSYQISQLSGKRDAINQYPLV